MMVTLNAAGSGEAPTSAGNTSSLASRSMVAKGHPLHRRRRVAKGTIAGFGGGYKASGGTNVVEPSSGTQSVFSPDSSGGDGGYTDMSNNTSSGPSSGGPSSSSSGHAVAHKPQHVTNAVSAPEKTCHSAKMAVLCCQNAIRLGARTQLGLCPPGRPRRGLQAALRQRSRTSHAGSSKRLSVSSAEPSGYYTLEKLVGPQSLEDYEDQEEDYLLSTNTFDVESDEEASSGDEDEISNIDAVLAPEAALSLDDESKYHNLSEPLFTPFGVENSLSNPNGAPMGGIGSNATGRLPFNRRKIRFFDGISAQDRQTARAYLRQETNKNKRRSALLLSRHLRRMQHQERIRRQRENGEEVHESLGDDKNLDPKDEELLHGGVSQFSQPMTASLSAALILESLALNPVESIEGMAKCYDGIVAAGVALLDTQVNNPTSPTERDEDRERPKATRSEVLAALAPLLITSLEQPSGDVVVLLARLRRMCATPRYQRRFVQRVAPCLVRPKNAAMWCLRHQHDMEPIVAAMELILDSANEIFSKGWYEKGQMYLADSKRAETLNSAATQLRNLSSDQKEGLSLGLNTQHHGMRRYAMGSTGQKEKSSGEPLAEWEVMAVDQEIRLSISKIMSSDWSRVHLSTVKDSDSVRSYRRATSSKRPGVIPQSSSGEASPRAIISPRSPGRPINAKSPVSSPPPKEQAPSQPESIDKVSEDSRPPQSPNLSERPTSPDSAFVHQSHAPLPLSPIYAQRHSQDDADSKSLSSQNNMSKLTPPRSPKSPMRDSSEQALTGKAGAGSTPFTPLSPRRNSAVSPPSSQNIKETPDANNSNKDSSPVPYTPSLGNGSAAPLSPSSIGTSSTAELVSYRPSSGSSVISSGSGGSQTAHYRTLTSTASERKRTVAACRALRAQITRFEEAFIQMHGRPPKGAAERAPLATTYSQYREWKRAIRADAACRIQALFRGARARWVLLRNSDAKMRHIVSGKAGRPDFGGDPRGIGPGRNQENLLNRIGIPVEIGENAAARNTSLKLFSGSSMTSSPNPPGDSFSSQSSHQQSLAPQWASQVVRRRQATGERAQEQGFASAVAPKPHQSPARPGPPSSSDINSLSISELQAKKRELKQQLKQYDMSFARKHGRMPVKAEKEPIRHLYENYNALKSQITALEHGVRQQHPSASIQQLSPVPAPATRQVMAAPPTPPDSSDSDRSIDSPGHTYTVGSGRGKRKNLKTPPIAATSTPVIPPSQDLADLKAEKGQLHQMLRSYEKDFFKEHRRQVSSFADIKPVASQYRRYKEIKKAIAALHQGVER